MIINFAFQIIKSFDKELSLTLNSLSSLLLTEQNAAAGMDPAPEKYAAASSDGVEEEEESGWTDYLEDFSSEIERESSFCSSIGSCSWVVNNSDANTNVLIPLSSVGEVLETPKKLSFKKTRTQKIFEDDSLEDTATSPVHSPKVGDLRVRPSHVNQRFDDHMMISSSMGSGRKPWENYYSESDTGKAVYPPPAEQLKKRGLCLYPLSMLLNYHG